ncbi:MAG: hypothetical protein ACFFDH_00355 [Promethearchaeota archaeon]
MVEVTDHALIRYMERIKGIDVEKIRSEIVSDLTEKQIKFFGKGLFKEKTHKLRVENYKVITVLPLGGKNEKNM